MVKVVFTDGSFYLFEDAEDFIHSSEHKMFYVECGKNTVMLPDHHVAAIGVWDDNNNKFI